jgi:carbonic anhydrase
LLGACCSAQWSHDPISLVGPPEWGQVNAKYATCGTTQNSVGEHQSPIDIVSADAVPYALPPIELDFQSLKPEKAEHDDSKGIEIKNTGHSIEIPYPPGSYLRLLEIGRSATQKGRRMDAYNLIQVDFHAPSEHTLNGKHYDLELQFLNRNTAGELAIVSVLLEKSEKSATAIDEIILAAPVESGKQKAVPESFDIRGALPKNLSYFTYIGSLTAPPCNEGVRWMVLKQTMFISANSLNRLHKTISTFDGYHGFADNNRPTQPLNDRKVLATP